MRIFRVLLNLSHMKLKPYTPFFYRCLVLACLGLVVFSCQEDNHAAEKSLQEEKMRSFSEKLTFPESGQVQLLPEAKNETAQWLAFITAQMEVKRMREFTVQDAVSNAETIRQIMKTMKTTIPDSLKVKPVLARVNVVVSLSNVLQQISANPNAAPVEIKKTAEKIPVAFENLKIQINEVFRKSLEDFQQEVETKLEMKEKPALKRPDTILNLKKS